MGGSVAVSRVCGAHVALPRRLLPFASFLCAPSLAVIKLHSFSRLVRGFRGAVGNRGLKKMPWLDARLWLVKERETHRQRELESTRNGQHNLLTNSMPQSGFPLHLSQRSSDAIHPLSRSRTGRNHHCALHLGIITFRTLLHRSNTLPNRTRNV